MRFEVKDQSAPQSFELRIDDATMRATDDGLQERIEVIRASEEAAKGK